MKNQKMHLFIVFVICFFIGISNVFAAEAKSIKIINNPKSMKVGENNLFSLDINMGSGVDFNEEVVWTSTDDKIATVTKTTTKNARVVGKSDGGVTITACVKGTTLCSGVSLIVGDAEAGRVRQIAVEDAEYTIKQTQSESIKIEVEMNGSNTFDGGNAEQDMIEWTSSDNSIAKVIWTSEQHAKITGVSAGTAVIKGCVARQPKVCTATRVVVKGSEKVTSDHEDRVASITLKPTSVNLKVGEDETVQVNYTENDKNKILDEDKITLVLTSSDKEVAAASTIDKNSIMIFGNSEGTATIKVCLSTKKDVCAELAVTVEGTVVGLNANGTPNTGQGSATGNADNPNINLGDTDVTYSCEGLIADELEAVIKFVLNAVRIAVPILLIVLCTLDFSQVVMSNDQDALKKATSKIVKRCLAALGFFLVPTIISLGIEWIDDSEYFNKNNVNCEEVYK